LEEDLRALVVLAQKMKVQLYHFDHAYHHVYLCENDDYVRSCVASRHQETDYDASYLSANETSIVSEI